MVRKDCRQLVTPQKLPIGDVQILAGSLLYQGLRFRAASANLLSQTVTFDAADWARIGATVAGAAIVVPDGSPTAQKLVESPGLSYHYLAQQVAFVYTPGSVMTFSVYVKASERAHVRIQIQDGTAFNDQIRADFSLTGNGSLTATGVNAQGAQVSGAIADVGSGWFRISVSGVPSPRYSNLEVDIGILLPDGTPQFTGDGASGLYIWGAQLETGPVATAY